MKKIVIGMMVLALSTSLWARRGEGPCMFDELNLTEKQQEKMVDLKRTHRDKMREMRTQTKEYRFEMMRALEDNFDEAKAKEYVDKIISLQKVKMLARIDLVKSVKGLLNEKQYKKMQLMRLWGSKGRRGGHKGRGNRGESNRNDE